MCLRESPTRQDTNWLAQLQRPARILKFRIYKLEVSFCLGSEKKGADQTARIRAGLSLPWLFAYGIRHIFSWPCSIPKRVLQCKFNYCHPLLQWPWLFNISKIFIGEMEKKKNNNSRMVITNLQIFNLNELFNFAHSEVSGICISYTF